MSKTPGPSGFSFFSTAEDVTEGLDLTGKTYLITGSNSGIGHETMRVLAMRGAHIIAAARTEEKAIGALSAIGHDGTPLACELSEPSHVRAAVQAVKEGGRTLDGIIANAGIMALPELNLKHGYELQFLTNHIGHFILVNGLVDQLAPNGRVVMLSSGAHRIAPEAGIEFDNFDGSQHYKAWTAYGQSKMANILFANALAKRFEGSGRTANSVHPGVIQTNLMRYRDDYDAVYERIGHDNLKTMGQGAATQTYVATHPSLAKVSGTYFADSNVKGTRAPAQDAELAEKLWQWTEAAVAKL